MSRYEEILGFFEGLATFVGTTIVSKLFGQKLGLAIGIINVLKELYTKYNTDSIMLQTGFTPAVEHLAQKTLDNYADLDKLYRDLDSLEATLKQHIPETLLESVYIRGALDIIRELKTKL